MPRPWTLLSPLAVSLLLLVVASAQEDKVTFVLTSGERVTGVVLDEGDAVLVRLSDGKQVEIAYDNIEEVIVHKFEGGGAEDPTQQEDPPQNEEEPPEDGPEEPGDSEGPGREATEDRKVDIPEAEPGDCTFCGGHEMRTCWVCGGEGSFVRYDQTLDCHHCKRRGQVKCEGCKGSGEIPDTAKKIQCPGCWASAEHSMTPGSWFCSVCWGGGKFWIKGDPKPRKCGVCRGKSGFHCALCSGKLAIPRLAAPKSKRDAEKWRAECREGLELMEALPFNGGAVTPRQLRDQAPRLPMLAKVADNLEELLDSARALAHRNIEGDEEVAQYFRTAAGRAVHLMIEIEKVLLQRELEYAGGE